MARFLAALILCSGALYVTAQDQAGLCPLTAPSPSSSSKSCSADSGCPSNQKCCTYNSNMRCTDPVIPNYQATFYIAGLPQETNENSLIKSYVETTFANTGTIADIEVERLGTCVRVFVSLQTQNEALVDIKMTALENDPVSINTFTGGPFYVTSHKNESLCPGAIANFNARLYIMGVNGSATTSQAKSVLDTAIGDVGKGWEFGAQEAGECLEIFLEAVLTSEEEVTVMDVLDDLEENGITLVAKTPPFKVTSSNDEAETCYASFFKNDCAAGKRFCPYRKHCILETAFCDGIDDCGDSSDELNCKCGTGQRACADGQLCVTEGALCDGKHDCTDHSDEQDCYFETYGVNVTLDSLWNSQMDNSQSSTYTRFTSAVETYMNDAFLPLSNYSHTRVLAFRPTADNKMSLAVDIVFRGHLDPAQVLRKQSDVLSGGIVYGIISIGVTSIQPVVTGPCARHECLDGVCVETNSQADCRCLPGQDPDTCQLLDCRGEEDYCGANNTKGCVYTPRQSGYACRCPPGLAGTQCDIDVCAQLGGSVCSVNGQCVGDLYNFTLCTCNNLFAGPFCGGRGTAGTDTLCRRQSQLASTFLQHLTGGDQVSQDFLNGNTLPQQLGALGYQQLEVPTCTDGGQYHHMCVYNISAVFDGGVCYCTNTDGTFNGLDYDNGQCGSPNTFDPDVKPGVCPTEEVGSVIMSCRKDQDCDGERKCCRVGAGRQCKAPLTEPPRRHGFSDSDRPRGVVMTPWRPGRKTTTDLETSPRETTAPENMTPADEDVEMPTEEAINLFNILSTLFGTDVENDSEAVVPVSYHKAIKYNDAILNNDAINYNDVINYNDAMNSPVASFALQDQDAVPDTETRYGHPVWRHKRSIDPSWMRGAPLLSAPSNGPARKRRELKGMARPKPFTPNSPGRPSVDAKGKPQGRPTLPNLPGMPDFPGMPNFGGNDDKKKPEQQGGTMQQRPGRQGRPTMPEIAGRPNVGGNDDKKKPEQPDRPTMQQRPGRQGRPTMPEIAGRPNVGGNDDKKKPEQPDRPTMQQRPGRQGRPTMPEIAGRPNVGGNDDKKKPEPGRPTMQQRPGRQGRPTMPEIAGRPNVGGNDDKKKPEQPDRPTMPNFPGMPNFGGNDNKKKPEQPGRQGRPTMPEIPGRPNVGGNDDKKKPEQPGRPVRPGMPERPGQPNGVNKDDKDKPPPTRPGQPNTNPNRPGGRPVPGNRPGGNRPTGNRPRPNTNNGTNPVRPVRPGGNRPGANRPGQNRPGANRPGANRPGQNRPGANRPDANKPGQNRPGANRPAQNRPGQNRPGANRPGANRPGQNRPGANRPGANKPGQNRPGANRPAQNRPGQNRPGANRPGANRPGQNKPGGNRPAQNRPGQNRPGANRPGQNRPGANRPTQNRPGQNRPGANRPGGNRPRPNRPKTTTAAPTTNATTPVPRNTNTSIPQTNQTLPHTVHNASSHSSNHTINGSSSYWPSYNDTIYNGSADWSKQNGTAYNGSNYWPHHDGYTSYNGSLYDGTGNETEGWMKSNHTMHNGTHGEYNSSHSESHNGTTHNATTNVTLGNDVTTPDPEPTFSMFSHNGTVVTTAKSGNTTTKTMTTTFGSTAIKSNTTTSGSGANVTTIVTTTLTSGNVSSVIRTVSSGNVTMTTITVGNQTVKISSQGGVVPELVSSDEKRRRKRSTVGKEDAYVSLARYMALARTLQDGMEEDRDI